MHVADWGEPTNFALRAAFLVVQLLDGFETTRDNVHGRLPAILAAADLDDVEQVDSIPTVLGTIGFYRATGGTASHSG